MQTIKQDEKQTNKTSYLLALKEEPELYKVVTKDT